VAGFPGFASCGPTLLLELLALKHGLMIAWDWGYRQVLCNSDSMDTLRLVLEGNIEFHHFGAINVMDIKDLLAREREVQLCHTLREGNSCADFLAKLGAESRSEFHIRDCPPPRIVPLLLANSMGINYRRDD
jgi:ribonuclease HI